MALPEPEVPLAEAALMVGALADPAAAEGGWLEILDEIAAGVAGLDELRMRLFVELGFRGNQLDYYDPGNSFLHRVIERRVGIPISLSVLTIEAGQRAGVTLEGVGLPGHFLVRDPVAGIYLDPYDAGAQIDPTKLDRGLDLLPAQSKLQMLARLLTNLIQIYQKRGERANLEYVLRLRLALPTTSPELRSGLQAAIRRLRSTLN